MSGQILPRCPTCDALMAANSEPHCASPSCPFWVRCKVCRTVLGPGELWFIEPADLKRWKAAS